MPSSNRCRRPGLTLIEVVAGLAMMATLLVTMLYLKSRYAHQQLAAHRRITAVTAADSLLQNWWHDPANLPRQASGTVPDHSELIWQTHRIPNLSAEKLGCEVVRLEIFPSIAAGAPTPLLSIEVMMSTPENHD